jgi:peroxiredoxin
MTFQDSVPDAQAFVKKFHMTFPVLLDETGEVARHVSPARDSNEFLC